MWRFAVGLTTGVSHLKRGDPCQDRAVAAIVRETLIVAVADGAGSAPCGGEGAEAAVSAALAHLSGQADAEADWSEEVHKAAQAARAAVNALAQAEGRPVRDYASTLLLAVSDATSGAALQLGDGVIAVRRNDDDAWTWIIWPQKGEYANTTRFLTEPDIDTVWEVAPLGPDVLDLAVMTDGLEALALNFAERAAHDSFFEGLLAPLRKSDALAEDARLSKSLTEFLASPRVADRADDDLSLVIASRRDRA
ncbi:hypothetical protein U91I_01001 [alpha proteobacterium U9-1i]|nr:hypothetical protein U91I_01001 [alpha proteobacterium U9-1i]